MVAPLVPIIVSTLARAATKGLAKKVIKNKIKKKAKEKAALKAKNAQVHKKIDAAKAAKKNQKVKLPRRQQFEVDRVKYHDKVGPKPTKEMIKKAGPVKVTKIPKTNKPKDPYGAPMRKVDKRTVRKYNTPLDK